jgi:biotin carboxyl carrier protein
MRRYTLEIRGREFVIDVQEQAADRFEVAVGGESYVVTLTGDEDLPEATIAPALAATGAPAPSAVHLPRESRPSPAAPPVPRRPVGKGGAGALTAPMPGVILDVGVKPGDTVDRGQVVAVLEAMKMQNSIKSPRAGTVAEVCVTVGQAVGHGDTIIRYRED